MKKKEKRDTGNKSSKIHAIRPTEKQRAADPTKNPFTFSQHLIPVSLIFSLALVLYANTLGNGFVYDDAVTIVKNTMIKDISNVSVLFGNKEYFAFSGEMTYRPVVTFSYFLDYSLYGLKPWGYHLTNTILHGLNGVTCYVLLVLLSKASLEDRLQVWHRFNTLAFLLSLLFVTHPIVTEAVNCVSFREDLLVFVFYMITLNIYLYLKTNSVNCRTSTTNILYALSCVAYLFALFSKEMALTLPLIIYCYEWVKADRKSDYQFHSLLLERYNMGYSAVTVFYLFIRFYYFYNPVKGPTWEFVDRLLSVPFLIFCYIKVLLFPVSLSADYAIEPVRYFFSLSFIFPLFLLSTLLFIAYLMRKRDKLLTFGVLFFFITLAPVYNIIPIANPFAERYLYLPIVGFILIAGSAVQSILRTEVSKKENLSRFTVILFFSMSAIYLIAVIDRNTSWNNDFLLWSDTIKKMPNSSRAHGGLGLFYAERHRLDDAKYELQTALRLNPDDADVHGNLGTVYAELGDFWKAIEEYQNAIKIMPYDAIFHHGLGLVYYKQGLFNEAVKEFLTALKQKPKYSFLHNSLGLVYYSMGHLDEAVNEYLIALKLDPDNVLTRNNLGLAYYDMGRLDEAIKELLIVLKINPYDVNAHYNYGRALAAKGLKNEAFKEFEMTLKLRPASINARQTIESLKSGRPTR